MFLAESCASTIERANLDGGNIASTQTTITGSIAVDSTGQTIYWGTPNTITRANFALGNPLPISSDPVAVVLGLDFAPKGIALDAAGGNVYWVDVGGNINRAPLDRSSNPTVLLSGIGSPQGIALDLTARKLYWTDPLAGTINRCNLDGSHVEKLVDPA